MGYIWVEAGKSRGDKVLGTVSSKIMMKIRISITLSDELIEKIERRRGLVKRSSYIEHLIERGFETQNGERAQNRRLS